MKLTYALLAVLIAASPAIAQEKKSKGTRFWNLTGETVAKFELAPAGTTTFGPDQCKNDKDGTVDNDERLKVVDIKDGKYDARLTDVKGRVCMAYGLDVKTDAVFSVEKDQLKDCKP
jgi:hypothetical protein